MSLKQSLICVAASLLLGIHAAEEFPRLPTWKCTTSGGCVQQNTSVVLDQVAKNGARGAGSRTASDYQALGVSTSGSALSLYHYVNRKSVSPRTYLLDNSAGKYVMMKLLDQELSVDVDYSTVPCGENGAFYLSEMAAGGAIGGTGYCDAQCA